jgi:gliding motility-associated-like protein
LKRNILLTLFIFSSFYSFSKGSDKYWVGGSGQWSEKTHWSAESGGQGGSEVPGKTDRVFFNELSFSGANQIVTITDSAFCKDFSCSGSNQKPTFISAGKNPTLLLSGSFFLPAINKINFEYQGNLVFTSANTEEIDFKGNTFQGSKIIFDGRGTWNLKGDLAAVNHTAFVMKQGHFNSHNFNLFFGDFVRIGNAPGVLDLGDSKIVVAHDWKIAATGTLKVIRLKTKFLFTDTLAFRHFNRRTMAIGNNIHVATTCVAAPITVILTMDSVVCNGQSNGAVFAVASGSSGYTYSWDPVPGGAIGQGTDSLTLIPVNTYGVTVTDSLGNSIYCSISVLSPSTLGVGWTPTAITCNGGCNGALKATPSGGTPGYTFSWTTGATTNTISALCVGTYTLKVTDKHGCNTTQTKTLNAPPLITPTPTFVAIRCFGACTGAASVSPTTGGTGAYTYSWTPAVPVLTGQGTASISNLCAGSYTCTITDHNNCSVTSIASITQPAAPLSNVATVLNNPLNCNGDCNASISEAISGGTTPYGYAWSNGDLTNSINSLCAGVYTLNVTDANSCPFTTSVNITQPTGVTITMTAVNEKCNAATTGKITVGVAGGSPGYGYSWVPGEPPASVITSLAAGLYTVFVTDNHGCVKSDTASILQPPPITITINPTMVTCTGAANGKASAFVTGGTGAYTYSWTPVPPAIAGQGTANVTALSPGTYTLTVTDANGCISSQTITITQPSSLVPNAVPTAQTCASPCDGSATANATGGVAPYLYTWTPPVGPAIVAQTITNLCAGNYTVNVKDFSGCIQTQVVAITSPAPIVETLTPNAVTCNGACDGSATASVTGGTAPYIYSWSPVVANTALISGQCAATYTCQVMDFHNCVATSTVIITQPNPLVANATATPVNCSGSNTGTICAAPTGGTVFYTYSWNPGAYSTACANTVPSGPYTVTVTDAHGCIASQTVTVNTPAAILPNVSKNDIKCAGQANGSAFAAPTGGTGAYTFSWTPGITGAQGQGTNTLLNLGAGTYTCLVTDANGCTGTQVFTILQPIILNAFISSTVPTCGTCQGIATVSVSGGTGGYTYGWNTLPVQSGPTASNLCVGTYTVNVADAVGCTASAVAIISQTVIINITTISTGVSCHDACDGSATANPSGGLAPYIYSWSPTGPPALSTQNVTSLCAGTYTVTIHDANGCFNSATQTFTNPTKIAPVLTQVNPSCSGLCNGSASVAVSGGTGAYTYSWTPGGQTTAFINGLCAGSYTLNVQDGNGCDSIMIFNLTQPVSILPHITSTFPSTCLACDGSISFAPSGGTPGYSYLWSPAEPSTASNNTLCAGLYTITVTDLLGCDTVVAFALSSPTGPSAVITPTMIACFGSCTGTATAAVSGGTLPLTYSWLPSAPAITGQGTTSATNLCAGNYTFRIQDAIGCLSFTSQTITQPPVLVLTPTIVNVTCGGAGNGSISVAVSGGTGLYTYSWSAPPGGTTNMISGLTPGNYTLKVTDGNGCSQTVVYPVTQPAILGVVVTATNVTCNGFCNGKDTAIVSGGTTPYLYSWSNGAASPSITNLCPGTYTANITDANGCTGSNTGSIAQPPVLTDAIVSTNASCNGLCDGSALVSAAGGTGPYTYLWAPGSQVSNSIPGLCAGNYCATSTDSKGCTVLGCVTILEPAVVAITLTPVNTTCNAICNGSITSAVTGGTGVYTYSWTPGGATTSSINALCPGTYTLTVTDAHGCTGSQTTVITQPAPLLAGSSGVNPSCNAICNGTAQSVPTGGTLPYTYSWSPLPGGSTSSLSSLCAGAYTVAVTDLNGCTNSQIVNIVDPVAITGTFAVGNSNCATCNGTISVNPAGGASPYTYAWSPGIIPSQGQGTSNLINLCPGIYAIVLTDAGGCSSTITAPPVNSIGGPTGVTIVDAAPTCYGVCNGSANCTAVIGGVAAFTYAWYDSLSTNLGIATTNISNLCAGGYFLKVTDANLCTFIQRIDLPSPAPFSANPTITQSSCTGNCNGAIALSPTGGTGAYTYSWSGGQTTSSLINLCAGSYTVKISDASGCDSTFVISFVPSTVLMSTVTKTNPSCNGICNGTATVSISAGTVPYTYQWSDPLGQSAATATGLCAGVYTVTVIDANGCRIVPTDTLTTNSPITAIPTIAAPTCGNCNGTASLVPSGGVSPYSYQWSNGSTFSSANNLCAGIYSVTVQDAGGCTSSFNLPVSNTSGPGQSTLNISNITCFGSCNGSATVIPNGGTAPYTYSWIPLPGQVTNTVSGLCAGLYFVEVKDLNGCIRTDSVLISQPANYNTHQVVVPTTCNLCNGTIALSPSGGTSPYTYSWTGALPATATQAGLCIGIDTVNITDATGCSHTFSMVINSSNSPSLTNLYTTPRCNSSCDGKDSVTATGGTPLYSYSWTPAPGSGQGTAVGKNLCAGSYTVMVTDAAGCANSLSFQLTQPQALAFSTPQITNNLCNAVCNGKVITIPSGGNAPYTYSWTPGGNTSMTDSLLCAGSYTLHLTDIKGCVDSQAVTIAQPSALAFTTSFVRPHCDNVAAGSITVTPFGGTTPYTYTWSGPAAFAATTQNLGNLLGGNYTLTVKDANGCNQILSDTLIPVISLEANAGPNKSFCTLDSVTLNASLSINAASYAWYIIPGQTPVGDTTVQTRVNPPAGATTYELIVGKAGCTDTAQIIVTSNAPPVVQAGPNQTILTNGSTVIGGNPTCATGVVYHWSPSATVNDSSNSNPSVNPFTTTTYTVTVTDANGCKSSDTMMVNVLPELIFSNGITPNGDGVNDRWAIDNIHKFPNNIVEIYNRWGELLFQEKNYQDDWDGTYKGKPLPVGTYYYLVDLHDPLYKTKYSGPITIMR